MEETEREDQALAYDIVLKNSYFFHKFDPLPEEPWFLKTQNMAFEILSSTLQQSKHDRKSFSRKISKTLIYYKALQEKENLKRVSLLSNSVEVAKLIERIKASERDTATSAEIRVKKSQSTKGPITVIIKLGKETHKLEEGEKLNVAINLESSMVLDFMLDDGEKLIEKGDIKVFFKHIVEETHYLKAMETNNLTGEVNKKGADYEVNIAVKLKLSNRDRLAILDQKNNEVIQQLDEKNEDMMIFAGLMESLCIKFDDENNVFLSLVKDNKKPRQGCCEECCLF